jgi:hypothetical protein
MAVDWPPLLFNGVLLCLSTANHRGKSITILALSSVKPP